MPKVTFIKTDGEKVEVDGAEGLSIMEVATANGIDIEAACEGSMACATCHLICDEAWFDKLEPVSEDEEDMLDLAFSVEATSRLSCQIRLTQKLDGIIFKLPKD